MRLRKMITDRFLSKPNVTLTVENIVDCAREVYGELFDSPFIDIIYEENDPGNYILL